MDHSRVYLQFNFLISLREARGRRQRLSNMTSAQTKALCQIAKRIADGTINPLRRDVGIFDRKRLVLRTLASGQVSVSRKKTLLQRHGSLVATMVREVYLIRVIMDEVRTREE